ncbi:unnamed protein product [Clonostachys byssicola]|uniref:Uncharacterized protein n=1 Tax=Clonostachys byssicola TaxID=160290 RepID=A0A9N9Y017_9HYPO|nr:unnamed protein product [Clonostachys byssicola]
MDFDITEIKHQATFRFDLEYATQDPLNVLMSQNQKDVMQEDILRCPSGAAASAKVITENERNMPHDKSRGEFLRH